MRMIVVRGEEGYEGGVVKMGGRGSEMGEKEGKMYVVVNWKDDKI
jgi:hypothetical protein